MFALRHFLPGILLSSAWFFALGVSLRGQAVASPPLHDEIGDSFSRLKESIHAEGEEVHHEADPPETPHPEEGHDIKNSHIKTEADATAQDGHPNTVQAEQSVHNSEKTDLPEESGNVSADSRSPFTGEIEKADYLQENGEYASAINIYVNLLNISDVPTLEHKKALFGLAETYFRRGSLSQSISLLDQFLEIFPDDQRNQEILFQIGLLYREMHLYSEAITAFYQVLNSIVVMGEANLPRYLKLARRSQFEIARSHFYAEQWSQSLALLDRIELFELNPRDRESLLFYKAHATVEMGDWDHGLELVQDFLHRYPSSPLIPEMLYAKADLLQKLEKDDDAVATLMELLEFGGLPDEESSEEWRRWRQHAGNQFANRYYQNQDFLAALRLYQGIAVLDDRPEWQLPIIFQMGLCFEKLGMYDRALESMHFVVQGLDALTQTEQSLDLALGQLQDRTNWRIDMLQWRAGLAQDKFANLAKNLTNPETDEE